MCVCVRDAGVHGAWPRARAPVSTLVVPIGRRVVMVTFGGQPRRRAEQPVRCSWTLRIARQPWLAGGAAVGTAGEWQAEG